MAVTTNWCAAMGATPISTGCRRASMKSASAKGAPVLPWRGSKLGRDERDFLPAALEITETPASPVGRAIAASIIAFLLIAIAWACLGHIDIIATAQGKIVPTGRVKVIQPLEAGIVTPGHVPGGDTVHRGPGLIAMDQTPNAADRDRARLDRTPPPL